MTEQVTDREHADKSELVKGTHIQFLHSAWPHHVVHMWIDFPALDPELLDKLMEQADDWEMRPAKEAEPCPSK